MGVSDLRTGIVLLFLGWHIATGVASASPAAPQVPNSPLTLMDALELTLRHNPDLRISEFTVESRAGLLQERQGQFDPTLTVDASLEYRQESLTARERQGQIDQRENLQTVIDQFAERISNQRLQLDEYIRAQQDPDNFTLSQPDAQGQLDLINELIDSAPDANTRQELEQLRLDWLERRRNEVQDSIDELQDNEASERDRLQKLGDVPEVNMSYFSSFNAAWRQPYRNGNVATWFAEMTHDGANFRGKPRDPSFGGKGIIDVYKSRLGVRLDIPLGQGGGRAVVTALERAAERDLEAEHYRLTHRAAQVVRQTADAYWSLVAAQMRRDVIAASAQRQQRLVDLADIMIRADLLPAVEIGRAQARQADAQASLASAEESLLAARLRLADSIGLTVRDEDHAPTAADAFPRVVDSQRLASLPLADLSRQAAETRRDRIAAQLGVDAARVLERAADLERRSRHDLEVELSASGLEESSSVLSGIDGAWTGKWVAPSARLGYRYSRPSNNDVALGRLRQASASRQQSEIVATDLQRRIHSNVLQTVHRLSDASRQAEYAESAIGLYRQAVANERQKIELGSATVIDLILTEERLTQAGLGLIAARQNYASTLVALRFETATLLHPDEHGYQLDAATIMRPPLADDDNAGSAP